MMRARVLVFGLLLLTQLSSQPGGTGDPPDLLTARYDGGNAEVGWQPAESQAGRQVVTALAAADWIGRVLPYGSATSVSVPDADR